MNIHYKTPVRIEKKAKIPDEELAKRQHDHMQRVYEQERRKKYLQELEDLEKRRHADFFTWVLSMKRSVTGEKPPDKPPGEKFG